MAKLKCPYIGSELDDFQQGGLHEAINKVVCANCHKGNPEVSCSDEDGKPECEGLAMMGIMENQIMHEGILFMRELVKVWSKIEDTEISCPVCKSHSMSLAIYWPSQILSDKQQHKDEDYWFCNGECQKWYKESECTKG